MSDTVNTPEFRVSFPKVFEPEKNDLNGKMEFSLQALFPKGADLSALKQLCKRACEKKWGTDPNNWPANLRLPFRDQGEKPLKDKETRQIVKDENGNPVMQPGHEAGAIFITLKTTYKPSVVDENVQDIIDPAKFYAGCWAIAAVHAFAYDQKGNQGVSLGLDAIQKVRDDEALGTTRVKPEEAFKPVEGVNGDEGDGTGPATAAAGASSLFD